MNKKEEGGEGRSWEKDEVLEEEMEKDVLGR